MTTEREYFNQGYELFEKGKYEEALIYYNKALELDPDDKEGICPSRGDCYYKLGQYQKAVEDYTKFIEAGGDDEADIFYSRGLCYKELGETTLAIFDFTKAIKLYSFYDEAYYHRGICYEENGQYEKAVKDFSKAVDHGFDDIAVLKCGLCYKKIGEYKKAIKEFNEFIEYNTEDNYEAYVNRGLCYLNIKQHKKALDDYFIVLELSDKQLEKNELEELKRQLLNLNEAKINKILANPEQYKKTKAIEFFNKANELRKNQCYTKAIHYYNYAISFNLNNSEVYYERGNCYEKIQNQDAKAVENYTKAINLNPDNITAHMRRCSCYLHLERYEEGVAASTEALKQEKLTDKRYNTLLLTRAACNYRLGKLEDSIADCTTVIERKSLPQNHPVYFKRGCCYAQLGQYKNAIDDFTIVEKEFGDWSYVTNARAYCYAGLQQYRKAIEDYSDLSAKIFKNEDLSAQSCRIGCYIKIGEYGKAKEYCKQILDSKDNIYHNSDSNELTKKCLSFCEDIYDRLINNSTEFDIDFSKLYYDPHENIHWHCLPKGWRM